MYHRYWDGNAWNPKSGWQPLGGTFASPPAIAVNPSGGSSHAVDVFAVGTDNQRYHRYLDKKGDWQPSTWEALGGIFIGPPAVSGLNVGDYPLNYGGTVNVLAIGADNQMYHKLLDGSRYNVGLCAIGICLRPGSDNQVYCNASTTGYYGAEDPGSPNPAAAWSGAQAMGGSCASAPSAAYCDDLSGIDGSVPR
jgi:hypothetical protein